MYKIAITNRHLCSIDIADKIAELTVYEMIILREKDLTREEYLNLAKRAIVVNDKVVLHSFIDVASELNYKKIHLPFDTFVRNSERLKDFELIGVSTHSVNEAQTAEKMGADYVTASHIFNTDCKKGLRPRGLDFLKAVCESVKIPVYALGGINNENAQDCIDAGAKGVCMMSEAMIDKGGENYG